MSRLIAIAIRNVRSDSSDHGSDLYCCHSLILLFKGANIMAT